MAISSVFCQEKSCHGLGKVLPLHKGAKTEESRTELQHSKIYRPGKPVPATLWWTSTSLPAQDVTALSMQLSASTAILAPTLHQAPSASRRLNWCSSTWRTNPLQSNSPIFIKPAAQPAVSGGRPRCIWPYETALRKILILFYFISFFVSRIVS